MAILNTPIRSILGTLNPVWCFQVDTEFDRRTICNARLFPGAVVGITQYTCVLDTSAIMCFASSATYCGYGIPILTICQFYFLVIFHAHV